MKRAKIIISPLMCILCRSSRGLAVTPLRPTKSDMVSQREYTNILINQLKTHGLNRTNVSEPLPDLLSVTPKFVVKRSREHDKSTVSAADQDKATTPTELPTASINMNDFMLPVNTREEISNELKDIKEKTDVFKNINEATDVVYLTSGQSIQDSLSTLKHWFQLLDLNRWRPTIRPSGNLAAYVPRSSTLTKLVQLGVDLSRVERISGAANLIVKLDFEIHIEPLIWNLADFGFPLKTISRLITNFPHVIMLPREELNARLSYFISRGFPQLNLVEMVHQQPKIMTLTSVEVDQHLGEVQSLFRVSTTDLRGAIIKRPKVILHPLWKIKDIFVILTKMMQLDVPRAGELVVQNPDLLLAERSHLINNYVYLNGELDLPLEKIYLFPHALTTQTHILRDRVAYLRQLGLFQCDPTKPLYTPLDTVISYSDTEFCQKIAHIEEEEYNQFLKSF